jgi:PAS domain-containing protein
MVETSELKQAKAEIQRLNNDLERRVAERTRQLQQNEAHLHEAQRLGHMGSWTRDLSSGTLFASPELIRIFGRDPEKEKLTASAIDESIYSGDRPFIEEVANKAESENTDFAVDHRIVLPDGSIRHVHSVAHPVFRIMEAKGILYVSRDSSKDLPLSYYDSSGVRFRPDAMPRRLVF